MSNLEQLRRRALDRIEFVTGSNGDGFVSRTELTSYLNSSGRELHGHLVTRYEDHLFTSAPTEFTLTGSASTYSLPSDVLKLRGVDYSLSGDWVPLRSFSWEDRGRWRRNAVIERWRGLPERRYRVMGRSLFLVPEGEAAGTYRFYYVPDWTDLVNASDELAAAFVPFEEYLVVDAAIKMRDKENSDVSVLMEQKRQLLNRIDTEASNRDASEQAFVGDASWLEVL